MTHPSPDTGDGLVEAVDTVFCDDTGLWVRDPLGNYRPFDFNDYESLASRISALEGEVEGKSNSSAISQSGCAIGSQLQALEPAAADGGWLYVKRLFFPLEVTRLSIPGSFKCTQMIEVVLKNGAVVQVEGADLDEAWANLEAAAKTLTTPPPRLPDSPMEGWKPIIHELQHIRIGMLDHYSAATILERLVAKSQQLPAIPKPPVAP